MQMYFSLFIDLSKMQTLFPYVGYQLLYFSEYVGTGSFIYFGYIPRKIVGPYDT